MKGMIRTSYNMDSKPVYKTGVNKDGKAKKKTLKSV